MIKKLIIVIMVGVFCFSFESPLRAEETIAFATYSKESIALAYSEKNIIPERNIMLGETKTDIIKKTLWFSLGWTAGFLFHETGHLVVAKLENVDNSYSNIFGSCFIKYHTNDNSKLRRISSAGFGAEILSSEFILGVNSIPKNNAFFLGWLAFDILNPVFYTLIDMQGGGYGDMRSLHQSDMNTDIVKAVLLAHSALSVYRLYENPYVMPYIGITKEEVSFFLAWKW